MQHTVSFEFKSSIFQTHVVFSMQGVMVRLMLVLAPVACILSGISVSSVLTSYMKVGLLFSRRAVAGRIAVSDPITFRVKFKADNHA